MKLAQVYEKRRSESHYDRIEVAAGYSLKVLSEEVPSAKIRAARRLGDAFQAACLFIFVVKKMQGFGCRTLRDLYSVSRTALGLF